MEREGRQSEKGVGRVGERKGERERETERERERRGRNKREKGGVRN